MRIDKYLKNARIIKRRTVAKAACDSGRVTVNGRPAKAGTQVEVGDTIGIAFGSGAEKIEVLAVPEHVTKDMAETLYRKLS